MEADLFVQLLKAEDNLAKAKAKIEADPDYQAARIALANAHTAYLFACQVEVKSV